MIQDFEKQLISSGSKYRFNRQDNIITVGNIQFILIALDQPQMLYGHNFNIFLTDELDELKQDVSIAANIAINERTRIDLPDGRKAFRTYTTTSQGLRGTYQITEEMRARNLKFALVRASTRNNTSLSMDYVKRLYALYDENERLAFLEGHFVNLTTGRVYPSFNDQTCIVDDLEIIEGETVYIGQDLNAGFSKAVAMVKRNKQLIAVQNFSFKEIGDAPRILRSTFPTNTIKWFPDASGKEIMKGYLDEMRFFKIELWIATHNPSILDRIFILNKMFKTDRLKVCKSCKDLIMSMKVRQFDENGNPEKGKGEKATDHIADSAEYCTYRIVSTDHDFRDLYELSNSYRQNK